MMGIKISDLVIKKHNLFKIKKTCESFIVADAQDIHNYQEIIGDALKKPNNFNKENIEDPDEKNVVKYDDNNVVKYDEINEKNADTPYIEHGDKKYLNICDFGTNYPHQVAACHNTSISQKFKQCGKKLLPNQLSCSVPNKIQASDYYNTYYQKIAVPLEDRLVRGYNYAEYSNNVEPKKIDIKILTRTTQGNPYSRELPESTNFAFHNTPAMRM